MAIDCLQERKGPPPIQLLFPHKREDFLLAQAAKRGSDRPGEEKAPRAFLVLQLLSPCCASSAGLRKLDHLLLLCFLTLFIIRLKTIFPVSVTITLPNTQSWVGRQPRGHIPMRRAFLWPHKTILKPSEPSPTQLWHFVLQNNNIVKKVMFFWL